MVRWERLRVLEQAREEALASAKIQAEREAEAAARAWADERTKLEESARADVVQLEQALKDCRAETSVLRAALLSKEEIERVLAKEAYLKDQHYARQIREAEQDAQKVIRHERRKSEAYIKKTTAEHTLQKTKIDHAHKEELLQI